MFNDTRRLMFEHVAIFYVDYPFVLTRYLIKHNEKSKSVKENITKHHHDTTILFTGKFSNPFNRNHELSNCVIVNVVYRLDLKITF